MRIISGKYKGKIINGFDIDGTRPTMDRIKESLFSSIQNKIKNSTCLDLFAGSGSLGIEALSNGAEYCYFVDNSKQILKILENNLNGIDNAILKKNNFEEALLEFMKENKKFDIIFLDPPYKLNLISKSIELILKYNLLNNKGIIICEYETEKINCDLEILKDKKYGSKKIKIYEFDKMNIK